MRIHSVKRFDSGAEAPADRDRDFQRDPSSA